MYLNKNNALGRIGLAVLKCIINIVSIILKFYAYSNINKVDFLKPFIIQIKQ